MMPKLTEELRLALQAHPGQPLRLEDEQTNRVYLVVSEESLPSFWEGERRGVARCEDGSSPRGGQLAAGHWADYDRGSCRSFGPPPKS